MGYSLLMAIVALILGEVLAFWLSRDMVLSYPAIGRRLLVALTYTLTNGQLLQWVLYVLILAMPIIGNDIGTALKNKIVKKRLG